jgi:hypothetical protein
MTYPYTARNWRERAERARVASEAAVDPEAKRAALEIAAGYERLAKITERAPRLVSA